MPYVTVEDYEEAFSASELADLIAGGQDFERQEAAASSLIDGYLAGRYVLPLASVPDMLRGWALDMVRYRLWSNQAPEEVRRRYEDALQQLRDLAAKRIDLPPGATGTPQAAAFNYAGESAERVFTMTTLQNF